MAATTMTFDEIGTIRNAFLSNKHVSPKRPKDLSFLSKHHHFIAKEKNNLEAALNALKTEQHDIVTNQTYAEHEALLRYYNGLLKQYHEKRNEAQSSDERTFADYVHDNLVYLHLYRILYTFARLTDDQLLRFFQEFATPWIDVENTLNLLALPVDIFNIFSVTLLGLRFAIESKRILEHTFFPTEAEAKETTWDERFFHEISKEKYGYNLCNDIIWATLNALSNYPDFFNIPVPIANALVLVCLGVDLSTILYKRQVETNEYHAQKALYQNEIADILAKKEPNNETHRVRLIILRQQLAALEESHASKEDALRFSLYAASILIVGFSTLLMASVPFSGPVGAALCLIGTALYTAVDAYVDYQQKTRRLSKLTNPDEIKQVEAEQQEAMYQGIKTLGINVICPVIFMSLLTVSWPLALLCFAAHVAYEMKPASKPAPEEAPEMPYFAPN